MRSQGDDKGIELSPPLKLSLNARWNTLTWTKNVEATPKNLRLRKKETPTKPGASARKNPASSGL